MLYGNTPSLGFFLAGFIDTLLNISYMIEARCILQNRLPAFRSFKKFYHSVKRHEILRGGFVHLYTGIINICSMALLFRGQQGNTELTLMGTLLLNRLLVYPALTAYRRVICQSEVIGMIPLRYKGVWHCMRLTAQ